MVASELLPAECEADVAMVLSEMSEVLRQEEYMAHDHQLSLKRLVHSMATFGLPVELQPRSKLPIGSLHEYHGRRSTSTIHSHADADSSSSPSAADVRFPESPSLLRKDEEKEDETPSLSVIKAAYESACRGRWGKQLAKTRCIWGISDLHVDDQANMEWVENLPCQPDDTIIVAGDIANTLKDLEYALSLLVDKYLHVFYLPGNHELWIPDGTWLYKHATSQTEAPEGYDSIEKFWDILNLCDRLGVHTLPAFVGEVLIVPLFSWYNGDFATGKPGLLKGFDHQCKWPKCIADRERGSLQSGIEHFFSSLNQRMLNYELPAWKASRPRDFPVVSFSHFVPRRELFPGFRQLLHVMGSKRIERQIELCGSNVHLFGHSHISMDELVDGTRMLQAALGHAEERGDDLKSQREQLARCSPVMLWRCTTQERPRRTTM